MKRRRLLLTAVAVILILACFALAGCSLFGGKNKDKDKNKNDDILDTKQYYLSTLWFDFEQVTYDGTPKTPAFKIMHLQEQLAEFSPSNSNGELKVEYYNNVNAGSGAVHITAVKSTRFVGGTTAVFEIGKAPRTEAASYGELKSALNGNYAEVVLTADITVGEDEDLTLPQAVILNINGKTLTNYGPISGDGQIKFADGSVIYDYGGLSVYNSNFYTVEGTATVYSSTYISNITSKEGLTVYKRGGFANSVLRKKDYDYTGAEISPELDLSGEEGLDYTLNISGNVNIGEGKVSLTATKNSRYYYGTKEIPFNILPVERTAADDAELAAILADANNTLVTLNGSFSTVTVPEGVQTTFKSGTISGKLTVAGSFIVTGDAVLGVTDMDNGGTVEINGRLNVSGTVNNSGAIVNSGKIFVADTASVGGDGTITNNGRAKIYADADVTATGGAVYRRHVITAEDVRIKEDIQYYDGKVKQCYVVFTDTDKNNASNYTSQVRYADEARRNERLIAPGLVKVTLTFKEESTTYTGTIDLYYTIARGKITVKTMGELAEAIADINYENICLELTITGNIELPAERNYIVEAGRTLYNESEAIFNGSLTVSGKYIEKGSHARLVPNAGLVIGGSSGSVAYFNDETPNGWTPTGNYYVRTPWDGSMFVDFPASVKLNSLDGAKPDVTAVFGETPLLEGTDYTLMYRFNTVYTTPEDTSKPSVGVTAKETSRYVYGSYSLFFDIERGEVQVTDQMQLFRALNSIRADTGVCNFKKVIFGADITIDSSLFKAPNAHSNPEVVIPADVTVEVGHYTWTFGTGGTYDIKNAGTIDTYKAFEGKFYKFGAGNYIGHADDAESLVALIGSCRFINLERSITAKSGFNSIHPKEDITIELNGRTLTGTWTMNVCSHSVILQSTTGRGYFNAAYYKTLQITAKTTTDNMNSKVILDNVSLGGQVEIGASNTVRSRSSYIELRNGATINGSTDLENASFKP